MWPYPHVKQDIPDIFAIFLQFFLHGHQLIETPVEESTPGFLDIAHPHLGDVVGIPLSRLHAKFNFILSCPEGPLPLTFPTNSDAVRPIQ